MPDYDSDAGLRRHLLLQSENIDRYAESVDADAAEIQSIKDDYAAMNWLMEYMQLLKSCLRATSEAKKGLVRGKKNAPFTKFPSAPPNEPPVELLSGIERRSRERDQRFIRAKGFGSAVRDALDLPGESTARTTVKPKIKLSESHEPYQFKIQVNDKAGSDMHDVIIRRFGQEKWERIASGTGKILVVTVEPSVEGQIERLEVYVQLKKRNQPFGETSNIDTITIYP